MIIKKPALSLSAYNNLLAPNSSQLAGHPQTSSACRRYATVTDGVLDGDSNGTLVDTWPEPRHPHRVPTPYQILNLQRGEQYTKARFTELVKLYHPDRSVHSSHEHLCRSVPQHTRLERYRLIIAAHTILSDPVKRRAYDSYGAGWGHHEDITFRQKDGGAASSHGADSPMGNATWEDWERWYNRRDGTGSQQPIFVSNTAFVSLILVLAALGGVGQATRADSTTKTILQIRDESHQKAAKELAKVRQEAISWGKDERIAMFLRMRDPDAYQDEGLRKLMLDMDVCDSGETRPQQVEFRRSYRETNFGVRHTPEGSEPMNKPPSR
jgi:DnaJ domain